MITAVAIAALAETHYSIARQVLLSEKDVFVEHSITLQCADCDTGQRHAGSNILAGTVEIMIGVDHYVSRPDIV